ncbi:MAG: hypothetical protein HZC28_06240 [Spirochaetes bacterium]|nr:hypothetical protein [Spirochaetota bacterium]
MKLFERIFPRKINQNTNLYNVFVVIMCAILFITIFLSFSAIAFFVINTAAMLTKREIGGQALIVGLPFTIIVLDFIICMFLLITNVKWRDDPPASPEDRGTVAKK